MAQQKTTVYLETADYRRLRALAQSEGRSTAELIREAVAEYAARRVPAPRPRSVGAGRSERGDVSERAEDLLSDFGESA